LNTIDKYRTENHCQMEKSSSIKQYINSSADQAKVKEDIVKYLTMETNQNPDRAEEQYNGLAIHTDILKEFHIWVTTKHYPDEKEGAVIIQGYTAKKLAEKTRGNLSPLGVYNYLISLREEPEEALKILKKDLINSRADAEEYYKYYLLHKKNMKKDYRTVAINTAEQAQMKRDIINYLTIERNEWDITAEFMFNGFANHEDILKEFYVWIKTKHYPEEKEGAIVVQGYTAGKIAAECRGMLEPIKVYQYLVKLREKPKEALEKIQGGLKNTKY
jgi:lysozyme family protein